MEVSDSFLKAQLEDVFWIGGAACGGKTTITDMLARKHGFAAYHPEDVYHKHKEAASPEDHPALLAPFHGWEWFFNRPVDEYMAAITDASREHFEMVVLDLVKLSANTKAVIDGFLLDPAQVKRLTDHRKAVFLYADEATVRRDFFERPDKEDILSIINTLADPAATRNHVQDVICALSARMLAEAEQAGVEVVVRDGDADLGETLKLVEEHFGLG